MPLTSVAPLRMRSKCTWWGSGGGRVAAAGNVIPLNRLLSNTGVSNGWHGLLISTVVGAPVTVVTVTMATSMITAYLFAAAC